MTTWLPFTDAPKPVYVAPGRVELPEAVQGVATDKVTVAPLSFYTWRELRLAGHHAPHPILHDYDWPGATPRDNQRKTAAFLASHARAICLNGMRTGKTYSTLWAADYLCRQGVVERMLIVAPKSTLESVWERAILTLLGTRYPWRILTGTASDKRTEAARHRTINIINPESLHLIADKAHYDLVVVDEATSMKNASSRRWKALHKLVGDDVPLWLLTATPTQHSPEDAYGLIRLLQRRYFSAKWWQAQTMLQVTKFKWVPKQDAEATVARHLQPAIRFTLDDCGDVPTVQREYLPVPQTKEQTELANALVKRAVADLEDGQQITAANAGALLAKILQVQGGGVYLSADGERVERKVDATPMYEAITEYVEAADTPVIVFCPFRVVARQVAQHLKAPLYWGDTKADERRRLVDEFQAGLHHAIVAVPETMSHGLTLDRARYVLWVLPPFKPETYAQACGRVLTANSKKRIVISHLVPSQVAKHRYDALENKERLQDTVLNLLGGSNE